LLDVLYNSVTHSSWDLAEIQNTQDDVIINLVMGSMFLVLPTFWMGAMTWAGVRDGVAVKGALAGGVKVALSYIETMQRCSEVARREIDKTGSE